MAKPGTARVMGGAMGGPMTGSMGDGLSGTMTRGMTGGPTIISGGALAPGRLLAPEGTSLPLNRSNSERYSTERDPRMRMQGFGQDWGTQPQAKPQLQAQSQPQPQAQAQVRTQVHPNANHHSRQGTHLDQ
eukprot:1382975-Amorphochlora_amoeboformis.AAC.1